MNAALLTLLSILPHEGAVHDRCDLMEVNHLFDDEGRRVFTQLVFLGRPRLHSLAHGEGFQPLAAPRLGTRWIRRDVVGRSERAQAGASAALRGDMAATRPGVGRPREATGGVPARADEGEVRESL